MSTKIPRSELAERLTASIAAGSEPWIESRPMTRYEINQAQRWIADTANRDARRDVVRRQFDLAWEKKARDARRSRMIEANPNRNDQANAAAMRRMAGAR